ncbi:amidohydrolase family protein [Pedobacter petrophilus]|uniref:Amidohydrolase family protein n=1 Tax=Pedobacter petrophilus TaxID=1908241 RepID=A0A7K0G2P1_9SPHI|nr:amidohydrolase [Pedobacter petrophilus]MRX77236.1 amidohydrolase family protein [Pedobacter petrophilus]
MKPILYTLFIAVVFASCSQKEQADVIVYNAKVYTVNNQFDTVEAFAVKDGKILELGSNKAIQSKFSAKNEVNADGKSVYPGFIDAHAHFFGYGQSLQAADLRDTKSWKEILQRLIEFAKTHPGGWLIGNGWDQNDWENKAFPTNEELSKLFPNRPVFLNRVDGHAAIVNQKAFIEAGITKAQKLTGGDMLTENGKLTGVLIDNAVALVESKIPAPDAKLAEKILTDAQTNCFAAGLTTIDDCGLPYQTVDLIQKLQQENKLKMRLYVMLADAPQNYDYLFKRGAIKTDRLNVRSFKVYADGALGSRGACLLHPYSDLPAKTGFLLSDQKHFEEVAEKIASHGFQMCTHAIGDSANRVMLKIYNKILKGKNDKRWRIEHAQIVNPNDFNLFGSASIIPSVQPTHATSDMYWATQRLGATRLKGAYAYRQLLKQNGWIPLGTDFPVENINPLLTFYAATVRADAKGFPKGGFQVENALTAEEALKGMTIWAAKANFEEQEKGSLEKGKLADFVILDQDLLKSSPQNILKTKVLKTYLNGEKVYEAK